MRHLLLFILSLFITTTSLAEVTDSLTLEDEIAPSNNRSKNIERYKKMITCSLSTGDFKTRHRPKENRSKNIQNFTEIMAPIFASVQPKFSDKDIQHYLAATHLATMGMSITKESYRYRRMRKKAYYGRGFILPVENKHMYAYLSDCEAEIQKSSTGTINQSKFSFMRPNYKGALVKDPEIISMKTTRGRRLMALTGLCPMLYNFNGSKKKTRYKGVPMDGKFFWPKLNRMRKRHRAQFYKIKNCFK